MARQVNDLILKDADKEGSNKLIKLVSTVRY